MRGALASLLFHHGTSASCTEKEDMATRAGGAGAEAERVVGGPGKACLPHGLVFPFLYIFFSFRERKRKNRSWMSFITQKILKQIFMVLELIKPSCSTFVFEEFQTFACDLNLNEIWLNLNLNGLIPFGQVLKLENSTQRNQMVVFCL